MKTLTYAGLLFLAGVTSLSAQTAATRIAEGKTLFATGDYLGADTKFQQAIALSPNLEEAIFWRQVSRLNTLSNQPEFAALMTAFGVANFSGDPANFAGDLTYVDDPEYAWTVVTANTFDGVDALLSPPVVQDNSSMRFTISLLPERTYRFRARLANVVGPTPASISVSTKMFSPFGEFDMSLTSSPLSSDAWSEVSFSTAGMFPPPGESTLEITVEVSNGFGFPGPSFRCLVDKLEATSGTPLPAPAPGTLGAALDFDTVVGFEKFEIPQPNSGFSVQTAVDYAKNTLLPAVQTARTELERIASPAFTTAYTEDAPFGLGETHTFDLADIKLAQAGLLGAESFLHYLSSKNWSVMARALHSDAVNDEISIEDLFLDSPQILSALPASPSAATAKQRLLSFISRYQAASALVTSRPLGQAAFFTLETPEDVQKNADFIVDLQRIEQSLAAPLMVAEAEEKIFLGPLFDPTFNPNGFLPKFNMDELIEESIQDTTFNGILEKSKRGALLTKLREDDLVVSDGSLDLVFNDWVAQKFTLAEKSNAAISGPTADPDGDGFTNLQEYAFYSDPKSKNSRNSPGATLLKEPFQPAKLVLEYVRPTYLPVGVAYRVEAAPSPAGPWLPLIPNLDYFEESADMGFSLVIKAFRPAVANQEFMRVVAVVQDN